MDSQLHSFAGMLFMKSSSEVTDDEIAKIKLFFVFIGASGWCRTATGLAYCSFTRHPEPKKPKRHEPNPDASTSCQHSAIWRTTSSLKG